MWQTYAQGYRNVTLGKCPVLSEMRHEACAQVYKKYDMRHVYKVIRNMAVMCTGLS